MPPNPYSTALSSQSSAHCLARGQPAASQAAYGSANAKAQKRYLEVKQCHAGKKPQGPLGPPSCQDCVDLNPALFGARATTLLQAGSVGWQVSLNDGVGCIHWQNTPTPRLRGRFLLRFWPTRCVGFVRRLRGGYAVLFGADLFSPTAIALGSSALVKVSGQNCFRTLYGSLGQIRLGLGHRWNWNQKPTRMPTQVA